MQRPGPGRSACRYGSTKLLVTRGNFPETTKTEPGHGYGLETIRRIARSNGGEAVCYTEKGQFILDVNLRF